MTINTQELTVKELKEKLKDIPDHWTVTISGTDGWTRTEGRTAKTVDIKSYDGTVVID